MWRSQQYPGTREVGVPPANAPAGGMGKCLSGSGLSAHPQVSGRAWHSSIHIRDVDYASPCSRADFGWVGVCQARFGHVARDSRTLASAYAGRVR